MPILSLLLRADHVIEWMNRRAFIATVAAPLFVPLAAEAQQAGKTYRLGWLTPTRPAPGHRVLVGSLRDLGYAEDKNLSIETRYADGQTERYPALAAELVALKVDVLVAQGNTAAIPASRATATIPIVMIGGIDPVGAGLAASLARPGGNVTGLLQDVGQDVVVKQLEILRQLLPAVVRVAVLMGPHQTSIDALPALEAAAPTLGMTLHPVLIYGPQDIDRAFATMIRNRADALVVLSNPIINDRPQPVVELAARHRIPAGYWWTGMVDRFGGLFSYGVAWADLYRRAATYIDKILKGAKPADLPIEQHKSEADSTPQNIIGTTEPVHPPVARPAPTIVEETVRRLLQSGGMVSVVMIVRELRLWTGCSRAGAYRAVADAFAAGAIKRT